MANMRSEEIQRLEAWETTCSACFEGKVTGGETEGGADDGVLDALEQAMAEGENGSQYMQLYTKPSDPFPDLALQVLCAHLTTTIYGQCTDSGLTTLYERSSASGAGNSMLYRKQSAASTLELHFLGTVVASQSSPAGKFLCAGTVEFESFTTNLFIVPASGSMRLSTTSSPAWVVKPVSPTVLSKGKVTPTMVTEKVPVAVDCDLECLSAFAPVKSLLFEMPTLRLADLQHCGESGEKTAQEKNSHKELILPTRPMFQEELAKRSKTASDNSCDKVAKSERAKAKHLLG